MAAVFFSSEVISNKKLNYKFNLIKLKVLDKEKFIFEPGQFTVIKIGPSLFRSYSFASHPSKLPSWEILADITPAGPGSKFLESLKTGQIVQHSSAKGIFSLDGDRVGINVMAATGCGLASMIPMIEELLKNSRNKILLFWGLREEKDLCLLDWLNAKTKNPNFSYQLVLSKPSALWKGITGHLVEPLVKFVGSVPAKKLYTYLCGNKSMIIDAQEALEKINFAKERIYYERYN
ncbi:MAG: FAD-binding oxidoreductase [Candidatus Daviesbacteria bacterium]|nr:FAD-binding oxidoreductase [Candidatus Daviesbacteria bacterium]